MSNRLAFEAISRKKSGTAESRRKRHAGLVPGVVYGAGEDNANIQMDHNKILNAIEKEAFHSSILDLTIDGALEQVILRDVQMHPASDVKVIHVDFMRVSRKEKLTMNIPIRFTGEEESYGVRMESGMITKAFNDFDVSCLPADLPEFIEIDVTDLKLGESVSYADLKLPEGVESPYLISGGDESAVIVSCSSQIVEVAEEEGEDEVEAGDVPTAGDDETTEGSDEG
ncbi:MAG: large subunit ribosomal protein L25 [Saprospiraceae bacterium]|jgi:large subunit ribosomal protein L25